MRDAFIHKLEELARTDPDLIFMVGDIGYKFTDSFAKSYPERFLNMGIAEANMISVASGMTHENKNPYVFTIIPFLCMRAYEQIRVDICIDNTPVKLVGVGGGFAYETLGATHHAIEDLSLMRSLPNMTVVVPCDPTECQKATETLNKLKQPMYLRLGRGKEPILTEKESSFEFGKAILMRDGTDATIVSCGPIIKEALDASDALKNLGLSVAVLNMHTLKPFDKETLLLMTKKTKNIFTLEEHSIIGGLGSAAAEVLASSNLTYTFERLGIPDVFTTTVGSREYLLDSYGLTAKHIYEKIKNKIVPLNHLYNTPEEKRKFPS